jgi:hypothetical protein
VARALASSGVKLVPDIVAGGGNGDGTSSLVGLLLATLVRDSVARSGGAGAKAGETSEGGR